MFVVFFGSVDFHWSVRCHGCWGSCVCWAVVLVLLTFLSCCVSVENGYKYISYFKKKATPTQKSSSMH